MTENEPPHPENSDGQTNDRAKSTHSETSLATAASSELATDVDSRKGAQLGHKVGIGISLTSLLLSATLAVFAWFVWNEWRAEQQSWQSTSNSHAVELQTQQSEILGIATHQRDIQNQLQKVDDGQRRLTQATEQSINLATRGQRDWMLAEVDYLLRMANERLQFTLDFNSATQLLESADKRLHDISDPDLLPLRQQLGREINTLKKMHRVDISGIAIKLDSMIENLHDLPLKTRKQIIKNTTKKQHDRPVEITIQNRDNWLDQIWHNIRTSLNSLVVIRSANNDRQLPVDEKNKIDFTLALGLRLESARLALFRIDETSFHYEIKQVMDKLNRYYDEGNPLVSDMISDLNTYSIMALKPELPDISVSWSLLNKIRDHKKAIVE